MSTLNKTILYVEDDKDDRDFLYDAITNLHPEIEIAEAQNGLEALEYLYRAKGKNGLPSLVVLDINMPVLDGKELLEKIKADPELDRVPIVVFTSSENPADKAFFMSRGIELISKPYFISVMPKIAKNLLSYCS